MHITRAPQTLDQHATLPPLSQPTHRTLPTHLSRSWPRRRRGPEVAECIPGGGAAPSGGTHPGQRRGPEATTRSPSGSVAPRRRCDPKATTCTVGGGMAPGPKAAAPRIQWRRGGADLGMIWCQGLQDGSRDLLRRRGRMSRSRDLALIR